MEIAEAVLWMCSERASFMTGQPLVLEASPGRAQSAGVAARCWSFAQTECERTRSRRVTCKVRVRIDAKISRVV